MIKRRQLLLGIVGGGLACALPLPAFAHRKKQALTTISWNQTTKNLEVIHDVFAHDAEHALARLGLIDKPDITGLRERAILAKYIMEHFSLSRINGKKINLSIVGAEVDSTIANIYMEANPRKKPKGLLIKNTIFQDVFYDQTNQVNIDFGQMVQTFVFTNSDGTKKYLPK